jgi:UDP:flavonoid glycosyltransferase YjiC (YdhE family)
MPRTSLLLQKVRPSLCLEKNHELPGFFDDIDPDIPLIWVYSGNPEYGGIVSWADSVIVLATAIEALAGENVQVVMTTGYHDLPERLSPLPENFRFEKFIKILSDPSYRMNAENLGRKMKCFGGAEQAARLIMEFEKTLKPHFS